MAVATAPILNVDELNMVDVADLRPHPQNIRKDLGDLTDMIASIRGDGRVWEPLLVLPDATIVCGHRRCAAAMQAEVRFVPCFVRDLTPQQQIEAMLVENLQRSDITPIEEATAYQQLIDLGEGEAEISVRVGMREERIRKRTALLQLPNQARELLETGAMTIAAAEELLRLREYPDEMKHIVESRCEHASAEHPVTHFWDVDYVLQRIHAEAERAKSAAAAQAKGLKVVDVPSTYSRKKTSPALIGTGYMEVPLKASEHAKLKCHAVTITEAGKLKPACTKPTSHPEFTAKTAASTGASKPEGTYEERRAAKDADRRTRLDIIREHLDVRATVEHMQRLIISGRITNAYGMFDDRTLCDVLDIAYEDDEPGRRGGVSKPATKAFLDWLVENDSMPLRIERACAAVVMLNTDDDMEEDYFEDASAIHHALWLRERGYTLNPDLQRIWDEDEQLESFAERIAKDPRLAFATGLDDIT